MDLKIDYEILYQHWLQEFQYDNLKGYGKFVQSETNYIVINHLREISS